MAQATPAAPPRHSVNGSMFTHMYAECLPHLNAIQHCKRLRGSAHPECVMLWDEIFLCFTQANCPQRFEKADKCIKESGRDACAKELNELSLCARYFWKVLDTPPVRKEMQELSLAETACLEYRVALRKCIIAATAEGEPLKSCRPIDEKLRDCYLRRLNPEAWKEYEDCTSDPKNDCSAQRRRLDQTLLTRTNRLLTALNFSPRELESEDLASLQHMTITVLSAAACEPGDVENALRHLNTQQDKV